MKTTRGIGFRWSVRDHMSWIGKLLGVVAMLAVAMVLISCASSGNSAGGDAKKVHVVAGALVSDRPGKLENFAEEIPKQRVFESSYTREQISSITFMSTIPESIKVKGWDVSAEGNGSVLAWFEENTGGYYDMTIAADGTIDAPKDCTNLFAGYVNVKSIKFDGVFDTSKAEDMSGMFQLCSSLRSMDSGGFFTSWVKNMRFMFNKCSSLTALDVSGFDTSKVADMRYMFNGCSSLTALDVSGFDTSKVTNVCAMFNGCSSLKSLDVSSFKTPAVTDMGWAFGGCAGLTSLNLTGWDVSHSEKYEGMFAGAKDTLEVRYPKGDAAWEALVARDDLKGTPRFVAV